ncbi:ATP-binding protein [Streptomyces formicae]
MNTDSAYPAGTEAVEFSATQYWPGDCRRTPKEVRAYVLLTLKHLGEDIPQDTRDALEVITSELVTNAVKHAPGREVGVTVTLAMTEVAVTVIDHGGTYEPLKPRQAAPDEEDGRGLELVAALASHWDQAPTHGGGTTVRAALALPAPVCEGPSA